MPFRFFFLFALRFAQLPFHSFPKRRPLIGRPEARLRFDPSVWQRRRRPSGGWGGGGGGGGGGVDQILERTKRTLVPPPTPDAIPESARRFIAGLIRAPPPHPPPPPSPRPHVVDCDVTGRPRTDSSLFFVCFFFFLRRLIEIEEEPIRVRTRVVPRVTWFLFDGSVFFSQRDYLWLGYRVFYLGFLPSFFFCAQNEQWLPERDVRKWHLKKKKKNSVKLGTKSGEGGTLSPAPPGSCGGFLIRLVPGS